MKKIIIAISILLSVVIYSRAETDSVKRIYLKMELDNLSDSLSIAINHGDYEFVCSKTPRILSFAEKVYGEESEEYATLLNDWALYNCDNGNYPEAIRLGSEAMSIQKEVLGETHPDYATSLNNLASYNAEIGNYPEAIRLGTEAMNIQKAVLGVSHPDYAVSLSNLAGYNSDIGNYDEAIRLGTEAMSILKEVLGETHPEYATSLGNLAKYNFNIGNNVEAIDLWQELFAIERENVFRLFSGLTNVERTNYWDKISYTFSELFPQMHYLLAGKMPTEALTEYSYDGVLISKNILLNSEIEFSKLIAESGDEQLNNLFGNLQMKRRFLTKLYEMPIAERPVDVDSLEAESVALERELIQKSKVYGDFTHNMNIDWKQVQSNLGGGDIAIEFVSFPTENDSVMYCALTLKKGYEYPRMIELFEATQLKEVDSTKYYTSRALSKLVWGPLKEELDGVTNVYFAPAGVLHNIAIESLPDFEENAYNYLFNKWNFYRLSSTRELAKTKPVSNPVNVALYGGIEYNVTGDFVFEKDTISPTNYYAQSRSLSDSIGLRGLSADYLPGTLNEVDLIRSLYVEQRVSPILYKGLAGSETSLKRLSGQRLSNLHIATHGFYWSESDVASNKDLAMQRFIQQDATPRYIEDKAMTRSGLLFAGANAALHGDTIPDGCDDGILTAQEIAMLDFRGCDLLVLSACQTGLGEIKGDGVFGLQRGFKKAGVQTIVMSLWKVDDEATQILMTTFYKSLLAGKTKRESFLIAQETVRNFVGEINGEMRDFSNPKYWAGFIMLDGID